MPVDIPQEFVTPAIYLCGAIVLLTLVGTLARTLTFCRRSIRECRISWRREGSGSRKHPNQDLTEGRPDPPALEAAKQVFSLLPGSTEPEPADTTRQLKSGDGPPAPAA
jgi:hypothetical protein